LNYQITLANPGGADARDVTAVCAIPKGTSYSDGSAVTSPADVARAMYDETRRAITWRGTLGREQQVIIAFGAAFTGRPGSSATIVCEAEVQLGSKRWSEALSTQLDPK
jgi:uncharacterized repeat protein (TIGR01451 family)